MYFSQVMMADSLRRLGFASNPDGTWIREDGIVCQRLTASCWKLSRQGRSGCRLITTRKRMDGEHDLVKQLGVALALMIAEEVSRVELMDHD